MPREPSANVSNAPARIGAAGQARQDRARLVQRLLQAAAAPGQPGLDLAPLLFAQRSVSVQALVTRANSGSVSVLLRFGYVLFETAR